MCVGHDLSLSVDDHHVQLDHGISQHSLRRFDRILCNGFGKWRATGCECFKGCVGIRMRRCSGTPSRFGQCCEIDLRPSRMQIQRTLCQFGDLARTTGDGEARNRMHAQIFQHPSGEIAHD